MTTSTGVLRAYAALVPAVAAVAALAAFRAGAAATRFAEIDVERINIVEADGTLRMVISNRERQHPGISDGEVIERDGPRPPGMIFFNHLGDEMGGLVFGENGGDGHFGSLTFDKVRGDQTIGFRHLESDDGAYSSGVEMWQQPRITLREMVARIDAIDTIQDATARRAAIRAMIDDGELTTRRLFLGKGRNDASVLELFDARGNPRLRMQVDPDGAPTLEFLDEAGQIVQRLPSNSLR